MPRTGARADIATGQLTEPLAPDDECPLSLTQIDPEHAVYVTPCGHVFNDSEGYLDGLKVRTAAKL